MKIGLPLNERSKKGSKDFRGGINLKGDSKFLNSSYTAISVSKRRRKKVPVLNGEGLCYGPYGHTGTGTARRSRVMKMAGRAFGTARRSRVMDLGLG